MNRSSERVVSQPLGLKQSFTDIHMSWWDDYLHDISKEERSIVVLRVMDCLMAHTILHEDPFLEEFIVNLNQRLGRAMKKKVPPAELVNPFQVGNLIFRTICMTAKFPTFIYNKDDNNQAALLKVADDRLKEVLKASKEKLVGPNVAAAASFAQDCVQSLKASMDSRQSYVDLMDALKTLFFTVSTRNGIVTQRNGASLVFDTFVCCDACSCNNHLTTSRYNIFLKALEVAKIVDIVMIAAVNENDALLHDCAYKLADAHFSITEDPSDDVSRFVHNGNLFFCRGSLFETLNLIKSLEKLPVGSKRVNGSLYLDKIAITLLWVKEQVKPIRVIDKLVPILDSALVTIEQGYSRFGRPDFSQDLYTLEKKIREVFRVLSAPEYHLAVHSRDVFVGKPSDMKCANVKCPSRTKELLKCSGCDVTYYCSSSCQKEDWERHKNFCHEIESRRLKVKPTGCVFGEIQTLHTVNYSIY